MPSPAAGKGDTPRTPTKLGRKSSNAPKLGKKDESDAPSLAQRASDETLRERDAPENVDDSKGKARGAGGDAQGKVSQAGDDLQRAEPRPIDDDDDDYLEDDEKTRIGVSNERDEKAIEQPRPRPRSTRRKTQDTEDAAEETGDDVTQKAGDEGEETQENTEDDATDAASNAQRKGSRALSGTRGLARRATDLAGKAPKDAKTTSQGASRSASRGARSASRGARSASRGAQNVAEGSRSAGNNVKDSVEDNSDQDLPDTPNLDVLRGLEVNDEGLINSKDGNPIGRLVEGDAEDLAGYAIGDNGEILDDDGDLVGRCELLPEAAQQQLKDAEKKMPPLSILKGLKADRSGQILNEDGDFVGHLVEGDPTKIEGLEFDENGEIYDNEGNLLARAELHPDAADLVDQNEDEEEEDEEAEGERGRTDGVADGVPGRTTRQASQAANRAEDTVNGAAGSAEDASADIEAELPGVDALEGMEINSKGEVLDDDGEIVGNLAEGNIDDVKGLSVNDQGEVVDSEGNVLGKVELAEGAADKLKEAAAGALDIRILEGLKVNKKGKVLDSEGEEVGELKDGDINACAGKSINEKGEVLDKNGKVIGKAGVVSGEAAFVAMKELKERLGEASETGEAEPEIKEVEVTPDIDTLEGMKVNKKGQVLNEDGEPIGELYEGNIDECAGKKLNAKGEVLDKDGNVIGKIRALSHTVEQEVSGEDDGEEEAEEEAEEGGYEDGNLPPLSILDGLKVNKSGKLIDSKGTVVGELIEGDAKKLAKSGITSDAEGQFWDNKGNVIGRAQTVPQEEGEEEAPFAGLEGLVVVKGGFVEDENGNRVGLVVEGDAKKLVGRSVDEDGDILDKKGSVVGHADRYDEPEEEEAEPEYVDLSSLEGLTVNKQGNVIGNEGVPVARLVEGNAKEIAGRKLDGEGQIWNDSGKVIGRVELIPPEEREAKPEGPFAGLQGLRVVADGQVADEDDNIVGIIVDGNAKRLVGLAVDEDGDVLDKYGNVKGHAEPLEDEEQVPDDLSILDGLALNKQGYLVDANGTPVGQLVEGKLEDLVGRKSDGEGQIHNDTGKVVGRCELIPENQRVTRKEGPFAGLEGLRVVKDGFVEDADGNRVGQITEGDHKKLVGNAVDEDGDIIDKYGNVKGHAEPWEEEDEPEADLSMLAGCTVNKAGNVVNDSGTILGRVSEGDPSTMIGKKVDGQGQIWDNAGNVIGRAELVAGANSGPEGPFAGFDNNQVQKDGTVTTEAGDIIGRVIEGEVEKLVGHTVDEDGDINDKNGNVIGKAERWQPEEKERRINPMSGMHVNKDGEVRDENGDLIGRLTAGDLGHCAGLEIDDNGYVIDNDGNKVGEVTLLENIQEEEDGELTEEEQQRKEDAELADQMATICQQTLERIQPVCKQITEYIEQADRTPRDELDEEELVNNVKPLIEEAGRILQECNGSLRGLDPDGRIAAQAKGRSQTRDATPEEYRLADLLKEITTNVVTTIDNAKKKIADMPHAKKKLNPLWSLMTEPLFQIIAAVGLLLTGVLNLVGKLLNGLGLGGLVNGLLGGLGIKKLLSGLGLGSVSEMLGGGKDKEKKKKGGGVSSIPIVGGLMGGGK
ncbi:hypothetical protein P280DRAFT_410166 [Massarina eburnea CBS 473.64]|uniref:DUF6987 domain-containing protein n=1 Tax=Massarina eburnea CBS 473.64 TaxID=1395130 RepID=A0A6A6RNZ1_9PLEO|nr:hypothetical protein P280DRAFT_410166 [Massarina eburnea CBS 473.64]